jgi:hypothetical protein
MSHSATSTNGILGGGEPSNRYGGERQIKESGERILGREGEDRKRGGRGGGLKSKPGLVDVEPQALVTN